MRPILNSGVYDMLCNHFNDMGNHIKLNEEMLPPGGRFQSGRPLVVRLDGSGFSRYTKDLCRPFDLTYRQIMVEVSKDLAVHYQADLFYTQSDEITLVWFNMSYIGRHGVNNVLPFDGRHKKIISETAGRCTSMFNKLTYERMPHKRGQIAYFDSRAYQPYTDDIALLSVRWRILDSIKNAVNQCLYFLEPNHNKFKGVKHQDRIKLLRDHETFDWDGTPSWLKEGTLMYKAKVLKDVGDLTHIPEKYRPTSPVYRTDWVNGIELFTGQNSGQFLLDALYGRYIK